MATLDETRRLNDWTLEQVMKQFKLDVALQVNRSEMEASICAASTSKMTDFVVHSTVNVLLALNVLTEHASQGTLSLNPEQAKCIENIDHYSHALHLLRQEKQRLRDKEKLMIRELISLHAGAAAAMQKKQRRQTVELPTAVKQQQQQETVSASEKRLQKGQAIARVRNLQIQLHARRGLLESTLAAHPAKPAQVPIQLGPLGMQDPSSKGTSSSTMSSKKHCSGDLGLKPGFEVELKSTNVDFISFIGSQFEPWTGQHQQHDHDSSTARTTSTTTPRVHTPKLVASPSPQSSSQQQHCWPIPSPPPISTPASALKLPQWKPLANKFIYNSEEELAMEEIQEELDLANDTLLLERHDKVLKGIRSQFEQAEEERKLRQRESGGLKSIKSTVSRTPSAAQLSRSTSSSGSGRRH